MRFDTAGLDARVLSFIPSSWNWMRGVKTIWRHFIFAVLLLQRHSLAIFVCTEWNIQYGMIQFQVSALWSFSLHAFCYIMLCATQHNTTSHQYCSLIWTWHRHFIPAASFIKFTALTDRPTDTHTAQCWREREREPRNVLYLYIVIVNERATMQNEAPFDSAQCFLANYIWTDRIRLVLCAVRECWGVSGYFLCWKIRLLPSIA